MEVGVGHHAQHALARDSAVIGILLAGGLGSRFGADRPKQLVRIGGHPIITYAARLMDGSGVFGRIVVAANPQAMQEITAACAASIDRTPWTVVAAGNTRNESVARAIAALDDGDARVLVHDAVRPLTTEVLVRSVAEALLDSRAVIPVVPAADRLVEVRDGVVTGFGDQATLTRGQSPGGFWLHDLRPAFEHNLRTGSPAFLSIFELVKDWDPTYRIIAIPGEDANIKITFPVDHGVAGYLLGAGALRSAP